MLGWGFPKVVDEFFALALAEIVIVVKVDLKEYALFLEDLRCDKDDHM